MRLGPLLGTPYTSTVKPRDKQCLGIKNDHTNRWACGNQTPILLTKVIHHKQCIRRKQSFWGMLIPRFYCTRNMTCETRCNAVELGPSMPRASTPRITSMMPPAVPRVVPDVWSTCLRYEVQICTMLKIPERTATVMLGRIVLCSRLSSDPIFAMLLQTDITASADDI